MKTKVDSNLDENCGNMGFPCDIFIHKYAKEISNCFSVWSYANHE